MIRFTAQSFVLLLAAILTAGLMAPAIATPSGNPAAPVELA